MAKIGTFPELISINAQNQNNYNHEKCGSLHSFPSVRIEEIHKLFRSLNDLFLRKCGRKTEGIRSDAMANAQDKLPFRVFIGC